MLLTLKFLINSLNKIYFSILSSKIIRNLRAIVDASTWIIWSSVCIGESRLDWKVTKSKDGDLSSFNKAIVSADSINGAAWLLAENSFLSFELVVKNLNKSDCWNSSADKQSASQSS